jgi:hypothetical protein
MKLKACHLPKAFLYFLIGYLKQAEHFVLFSLFHPKLESFHE